MLLLLWQLFRFLVRLGCALAITFAWLFFSALIYWKGFTWCTTTIVEDTVDYVWEAKRVGKWAGVPWW